VAAACLVPSSASNSPTCPAALTRLALYKLQRHLPHDTCTPYTQHVDSQQVVLRSYGQSWGGRGTTKRVGCWQPEIKSARFGEEPGWPGCWDRAEIRGRSRKDSDKVREHSIGTTSFWQRHDPMVLLGLANNATSDTTLHTLHAPPPTRHVTCLIPDSTRSTLHPSHLVPYSAASHATRHTPHTNTTTKLRRTSGAPLKRQRRASLKATGLFASGGPIDVVLRRLRVERHRVRRHRVVDLPCTRATQRNNNNSRDFLPMIHSVQAKRFDQGAKLCPDSPAEGSVASTPARA
jgi:hypothetical protein